MEESREKFNKIKKANQVMLDYFNHSFVDQLEEIQKIKTQIFEIDVRIDELDKTKDIYAFKTNSRKSVFSPTVNDGIETERNKIIQEQISDLLSVKESLTLSLAKKDHEINKLRNYLETLNEAADALSSFDQKYETDDPDHTDMDGFTFVQEKTSADITSHGYNILMLNAFDRALIQTMLDKNVAAGLDSIVNKLDMMSYLIGTDVTRAKLTLQEIIHGTKQIISSVNDVESKLCDSSDSTISIKEQIENYLNQFKHNNPALEIQASLEMPESDINYQPVFGMNLMHLINIFFNNIADHAGASNVIFHASLTPNAIDVLITDDGTGIDDDYLANTPWYSSLHKAHELIYLLNGKLNISGDFMSGTTIKFSFPVL